MSRLHISDEPLAADRQAAQTPALHYRRADATDEQVVVPLMYEASRDLFEFVMPPEASGGVSAQALGFLGADYRRGNGIFGAAQQRVMVDAKGAVVATVTAYGGHAYPRLMASTLASALRAIGLRGVASTLLRSRPLSGLFIRPKASELFMANLCVDASYRGQGVFRTMLQGLLREARAGGYTAISCDVSADNISARDAYLASGFRVVERRVSKVARVSDFIRLQKTLD